MRLVNKIYYAPKHLPQLSKKTFDLTWFQIVVNTQGSLLQAQTIAATEWQWTWASVVTTTKLADNTYSFENGQSVHIKSYSKILC